MYIFLLALLGISIINLVFSFYELKKIKTKIFLSIIGTIYNCFIILNNSVRIEIDIKIIILLSLLFTMAVTDFKNNDIININIYLSYLSIICFLIIDLVKGNDILFKVKIIVVALIICKIFNFLNMLGEGDNPIIAIIMYMFPGDYLVIIVISLMINLIISFIRFRKLNNEIDIALAPGFYIVVSIATLSII